MPTNVPYRQTYPARVAHALHDVHGRIEQQLAGLVATRTDEWLERYPGPGFRRTLPLSLTSKYQGAKAITVDGQPLHGVIWLTVTSNIGQPDYHLDIRIAGKRCRIRHRIPDQSDATMRVSLANMIRMAAGAAESSIVMSHGGISVTGNAFLLAGFPGLFGLPSRSVLPTYATPNP
ncbi:MAG TPA: SCP2 sterol-binding domain-containing protein [Rariglobus sp.]